MDNFENTYLSKHRRIIDALSVKIQTGVLKPYDQLPTDRELCKHWKVSRCTVRKAMDHLADRGLIFRAPGKGSFVAFHKITHDTPQDPSMKVEIKGYRFEMLFD